ncbi:MAG: c-type cytochrome biogenesis protein CcmI [Hyphomicrobiales bacterium]|nr:c-type cytochrome biogenesis protein CcmI [Hyphomicrobiales bacterium]
MNVIWIVGTVLTIAVIGLTFWPLRHRRGNAIPSMRTAYALRLYQDQLREIEREQSEGQISASEAEAIRTEIKRRILKLEADAAKHTTEGRPVSTSASLVVTIVLAIGLPAGAVSLYLHLGAPEMADQPFAERHPQAEQLASHLTPEQREYLNKSAALLQQRLSKNDKDPEAWRLLGLTYRALGDAPAAVSALRRAYDLSEGSPEVAADYGELLVAVAGGRVIEEAASAFESALRGNADEPRARYYLALRRAQLGDVQGALQAWNDLIAVSPADAPWLPQVRSQVARASAALGLVPPDEATKPQQQMGARKPQPSQEEINKAAAMTEEERQAMIRAMVDGLAARLEQNPDDREGWLRLARAYDVLGEVERAEKARARADSLR